MTLREWLAASGLTHHDFAKLIDRSPEAVRRYVAGERIPDKATMPLIAEKTNGAVTANDFFGIKATAASPKSVKPRKDISPFPARSGGTTEVAAL